MLALALSHCCLGLEGLKITQLWILDGADIRPDIAMGDTFTATVVSHESRREERQDWNRRGEKSQGSQILTEERGLGSEREHIRDDVRDLRRNIDMKVWAISH